MMMERPNNIHFFSPGLGPNHKFDDIDDLEREDATPQGSDGLLGFSNKLKNMEMKDVFNIDMAGIQADCFSNYLAENRKDSFEECGKLGDMNKFDKLMGS